MSRPILLILYFLSATAVHAQLSKEDSLLRLLKTAKDDTVKVNLLRDIGGCVIGQDPNKAIAYWQQGLDLSRKLNFTPGTIRSFINIGTAHSYLAQFDSTLVCTDSALLYAKKENHPNRLALIYLNKADVYRNLANYKNALLYCDTAHTYAMKTGNTDRLARIYDIMSGVYAEQRQFALSNSYLGKALETYKKDNNFRMISSVYDDIAYNYRETGNGDSALFFLNKAIRLADSIQDFSNHAAYYAGVATLYFEKKDYNTAEGYALKSLEYGREQGNQTNEGSAYGLLCKIYIEQKRFTEAVAAGRKAYDIAVAEENILWQGQHAGFLAEAYAGAGDYVNAYKLSTINNNLTDTLARQRYDSEIAGLQASFELKDKDNRILLLSKDQELQKQRLFRQRVWIGAAIVLLLLLLLGVIFYMNRNRLQQRMKELELRNQIAADLHDEVGSSLSSIHLLSQMAARHSDNGKQENEIWSRVSTNARETMEKMGDIVWMIKPGEAEGAGLVERMKRFAYEMCSCRDIEYQFDAANLETAKLTMQQRKNIYLVFKEALNNAVKYSGAGKIIITAQTINGQLSVQVKDDGKGFDTLQKRQGNGLENMTNRASDLGGKLDIYSSGETGTSVQLSMPL